MNTNHEAMDDMSDYAIERHVLLQSIDKALQPRAFIPQGCDQQGRHEPTIPPRPENAIMGMYEDAEEQMRSADGEVLPYFIVGVICWVCFIVWVLSGGAA